MINPYHGNNPAIEDCKKLIGRENEFKQLDFHIKNGRSVVVMGVEGVGKSSFLRCYFNWQHRQEIALKDKLLINVTDFPIERDSDGIYQYLAEGVISAVDTLDQEATLEIHKTLKQHCRNKMAESIDTASKFKNVCEVLNRFGYRVMLVIDEYERFVSSTNVSMEHHDLLNALIRKNLCFVVATNYDFTKDSLPPNVSGSFLLQKFSGNEIRLKGLTENQCKEYIQSIDSEAFTENEIHQIYLLSGGIPKILRRVSEYALSQKLEQKSLLENAESWQAIKKNVYECDEIQLLLKRWCKLFSENQIKILTFMSTENQKHFSFDDANWKSAAVTLFDRGLLSNPYDASGNPFTDKYKFCTSLLKQYCLDNTLKVEALPLGEKLMKAVDEGDTPLISDIIAAYARITEKNPSWVHPVNFSENISDEILNEYSLSQEFLQSLNQTVAGFLKNGILVERTFSNVDMIDYSPCYLSFAKAIEKQMNLTVLPVFKSLFPHYKIQKNAELNDSKINYLSLGNFKVILGSSYSPMGRTYIEHAVLTFAGNNLKQFNTTWWNKFNDDLFEIKEGRNDMPHINYFKTDKGKKFLQMLFLKDGGFLRRCQNLYDSAKRAKII